MANWIHKLELADVWNACDPESAKSIKQLCHAIARRLQGITLSPECEEEIVEKRDQIVEELMALSDDTDHTIAAVDLLDEFNNSIMYELYNWGDTLIGNEWPPKKVCWIST